MSVADYSVAAAPHLRAPTEQGALSLLLRLVSDRAANPARHKTKICLFLGAGADISSGGLSFSELKRQAIEKYLGSPVFDVTQPDEIDARFESLFAGLETSDRALLIEAVFERMGPLEPSDGYKLLVLLAEAGGIDAVVTTNFDLMLERAQARLGRDLFQVFAPGTARPDLNTYSRYELPKRPYIKLHGDLATRTVAYLATDELDHAAYEPATLQLLTSILATHDLILAGYGGFDPALARVIADAIGSSDSRVFWCSPHRPSANSPLYQRLGDDRIIFVPAVFDDLVASLSRPVLERPSLIPTEPTYVQCLFDWRVEYANREYVKLYGERGGKPITDQLVPRKPVEEAIGNFLQPNRPLAVITGPSGFGKTSIGLRLHKRWQANQYTRILLLRSRAFPENGDLEQYIGEQLGGLGVREPFSLSRLERWLALRQLRLVVFVDGVNEFSPDIVRCVSFLRNILRFCYFLPEADSAIRVITTIRQETWNAMLPHLDLAQLRKTIWAGAESGQSFHTIACDAFNDDEVAGALARLGRPGRASIDPHKLPLSAVKLLRDPYFLRLMAEAVDQGMPAAPTPRLFKIVFDERLRKSGSSISPATLEDVLATLALRCLETRREQFRESDVHPAELRAELLRVAKDLNVIVSVDQGFLQFEHDRTYEYFLAIALASGRGPPLETLHDLLAYLKQYRGEGRPLAAARLCLQLNPQSGLTLASAALALLDAAASPFPPGDAALLSGFAREILVEMAEYDDPLARAYVADAIGAARSGRIGVNHARTIVRAASRMGVADVIGLLARATHPGSLVVQIEAHIYAIDKLVKLFLLAGAPPVDLLADAPYRTFFNDPGVPLWKQVGRLLSFASQIGPDNSNPQEYAAARQALAKAFSALRRAPATEEQATDFTGFFLAACDRLLFNATPEGIGRFFGNPLRQEFGALVDRLDAGAILSEADLRLLEPYTQSLSSDLEYHLAHACFALSSMNDLPATLDLAERRFATFSNETAPEEIDFFQAVLVYLHVLHGLTYDPSRFRPWEETILDRWPNVLLYRPGLERGEQRGFRDTFDRIFEDGFGAIYSYGILSPSLRRRALDYAAYLRSADAGGQDPLPLYTHHLETFLSHGRVDEALQVLQAISGVLVTWPREGLAALRTVIGNADPRVRRAVMRILSEAFNRHPEETMAFFRSAGVVITDDELVDIKVRFDPPIARRQIAEEEWARMGHFLLTLPGARTHLSAALRALLQAPSLEAAVREMFQALGLSISADQ